MSAFSVMYTQQANWNYELRGMEWILEGGLGL